MPEPSQDFMNVYYTDTAKQQLKELEGHLQKRILDKVALYASQPNPLEFAELTAWSIATGAKGDGLTVMVAGAVLDVPNALASVNWKLAAPLNPVVGVKVTVVAA